MDVTLTEQIAEVRRAIALRTQGIGQTAKEKRQLQAMQAALKTLQLVEFAQTQLPFFDEIAASGTGRG